MGVHTDSPGKYVQRILAHTSVCFGRLWKGPSHFKGGIASTSSSHVCLKTADEYIIIMCRVSTVHNYFLFWNSPSLLCCACILLFKTLSSILWFKAVNEDCICQHNIMLLLNLNLFICAKLYQALDRFCIIILLPFQIISYSKNLGESNHFKIWPKL